MKSERKSRVWPAVAALLLLVPGIHGCSGDKTAEPVEPAAGEAEILPDQVLFDYVLTETEAGVPSWELASDRLERFVKKGDAKDEVELYNVRMRFFRDGEPYSLLTSERGRANMKTKEIFTWGDVVVVTTDGRRLETEELHYDNVRERIHNDVFDRFTRLGDVMTGYGMEATPDLDFFELKRRVNAEVTDDAGGEGSGDERTAD